MTEKETSSDDAKKSKSAPDIFHAALKRLHLEGSHCLALGDTPWDIQAAAKAGVRTVALTCGGWTEQELTQAGALEVYRHPSDLINRFAGSVFSR